MSFYWDGDAFLAGFCAKMTTNVASAANLVKDKMKQLTGIQGPPRSVPGEPPHMDTTELNKTIAVIGPADDGDMIIASIGSPVPQAAYMEYGTRRVAARPWASRALRESQQAVVSVIVANNQLAGTP